MELVFLVLLILLMASALASGFPVAFALPGSAIITIGAASLAGYLFAGDPSAYFAQGGPTQWLNAGVTNFRGVYWEVERDTLIAIPLFIFMGIMLQRSKIAEDLLVAMAQLFGPIPGGLGISVVFVGALLAATTGIVGATVVAMGLISLPAMLRNNYSKALATGTIAASGTLGQIIPPSIVLIILADQLSSAVDQADTARKALYKEATGDFSIPSSFSVLSTSAGDMFLGAFVPGLVLVGLYMLFILVIAFFKPKLAPAVPFEGSYDSRFVGRVLLILVPPLALIFLVLGSIILGIATVNQAGAIGAAGATVMAGYRLHEGKKRAYWPAIMTIGALIAIFLVTSNFSTNVKSIHTGSDVLGVTLAALAVLVLVVGLFWSGWRTFKIDETLRGVMVETAKTTSLVFIILLGAAMLTAAFRAFGGEELVKEFLTGLPGGFWPQFIVVMAVIFILGFFLEFIEIAVVVVPIVAPILLADPSANITAVWLGVMIGMNIQTSFLTPPFGFALFYLRGVAPAIVKTVQMYKGVIAFIGLQLVGLLIVGIYPSLVNYLPSRVSLTSDTAPPPVNPRLQYCIEEYVFTAFRTRGEPIHAAIAQAGALDTSYLPQKLRKAADASIQKAGMTLALLEEIRQREAVVSDAAPGYRPLHTRVRQLEKAVRKLETEVAELTQELDRSARNGGPSEDRLAELADKIEVLIQERDSLLSEIPDTWEAEHTAFAGLLKAEEKARLAYRRNVDDAYGPINDVMTVVADAQKLAGLEEHLAGLGELVAGLDPQEGEKRIKAVSKMLRAAEGTSAIRSLLSKAAKELKRKEPAPEKAAQKLAEALQTYRDEVAWRTRASEELLPGLRAYEAAIRDTIGLRQQNKLPLEQALEVAKCSAVHRDISLNF